MSALAINHVVIIAWVRRTRLSNRAFPVAAADTWNSLPQQVTSTSSLPVFESRLNTVLPVTAEFSRSDSCHFRRLSSSSCVTSLRQADNLYIIRTKFVDSARAVYPGPTARPVLAARQTIRRRCRRPAAAWVAAGGPDSPIRRKTGRPQVPVMPPP